MRVLKMMLNRLLNHASPREVSKLIVPTRTTELPLVSKNLTPSVISVKGNKKYKIQAGQKLSFASACLHQHYCFDIG